MKLEYTQTHFEMIITETEDWFFRQRNHMNFLSSPFKYGAHEKFSLAKRPIKINCEEFVCGKNATKTIWLKIESVFCAKCIHIHPLEYLYSMAPLVAICWLFQLVFSFNLITFFHYIWTIGAWIWSQFKDTSDTLHLSFSCWTYKVWLKFRKKTQQKYRKMHLWIPTI